MLAMTAVPSNRNITVGLISIRIACHDSRQGHEVRSILEDLNIRM